MRSKFLAIFEADVISIAQHNLPWEELAGCRVLVTGAAGFLGGYLVRTLLSLYQLGKVSRPLQVLAMARDLDKAQIRFSDLLQNPDFNLLHWDLNNISLPDIGPVNYIIHAASQASPRFYGIDPVGTLLPNTVGTAALLEALRRTPNPKALLFVSSSEIYGEIAEDTPLSESRYGVVDPAMLRSCYSESKRVGETMCVAWHHQYGIPAFIARPFHIYGPGLLPEDGRVFSDFAFNVIRNENIIMKSDGAARRAFCYATDAITGFFSVLLKGTPATPYNVANPDGELSIIELAETLTLLFPEKHLAVERRLDAGGNGYIQSTYSRLIPDVSRLQSLGWRAEVTPRQGFKRMIEAEQQ